MLKKVRKSNNLVNYIRQVPIIDTDPVSNYYFRIVDFPSTFYCGKNAIRIQANNKTLAVGSSIFIDIVDANGNPVYYEILDTVGKDKTRIIIVYVYEDTPPGDVTVFIAGRATIDKNTGQAIKYSRSNDSDQYYNIPNVVWTRKATVAPSRQNNSEVFFSDDPIITFNEIKYPYKENVTSEFRNVLQTGVGGLYIAPSVTPSQFESSTKIANKLKYTDDSSKVIVNPQLLDKGSGITKPALVLPKYNHLPVATTDTFEFSSSMKGGQLIANQINLAPYAPKDAQDSTIFNTAIQFSASIVDVINRNTVVLDRSFNHVVKYKDTQGQVRTISFNTIKNHNNFTASFLRASNYTSTPATESFVRMEFERLEPTVGAVDSIQIKYKPIGSTGEFMDVGLFDIYENNLLVDSEVTQDTQYDGLKFKDIGDVLSQSEADTYWSAIRSSPAGTTSAPITYSSQFLINAIRVNHTGIANPSNYIIIQNNSFYNTELKPDTEYVVRFNTHVQQDPTSSIPTQLDVYINGVDSTIDSTFSKYNTAPIKDSSLGTYIGSINGKLGKIQSNNLFFNTVTGGNAGLRFVVRSGIWDLSSITVQARKSTGYTPNHVRLDIPVNQFRRDTELILNVDYYNRDGIRANTTGKIFGAYFTGSNAWFKGRDNVFSGSFSGSYTGPCPTSCRSGSFTGSFTGSHDGDFDGRFTGSFTGSYGGDFKGRFTGSYEGDFVGKATGSFTGSFDGKIEGFATGSFFVRGSGSSVPLFEVIGSQGQLFSVVDTFSGSLFSVNNISGLPLFDIDSSGDITLGDFFDPAIFISGSGNVGVGTDAPTTKLHISGSIRIQDGAIYDNNNLPGTSGQIAQATGTGFVWADNIADSANDLLATGKNMESTTIAKGTPLYFSASNASGNIVGVYRADAGNINRMPAGGVAAETIASGSEGSVYLYGFINGVNTSTFKSGDSVYVAVGGGYTNIKPTGSALIQKLGNVEKSHATNGSGVIQGPSWFNDLPNWEGGKIKVGRNDGQPVTSSFIHLDETNQFLGVGTDTPRARLDLTGDSTDEVIIYMTQYSSDADPPNFRVEKLRGAPSSPTTVLNGDGLFSLNSFGYHFSDYRLAGQFRFDVDGTPSGGNIPTKFTLKTDNGSGLADRFVVKGNGKVEITGSVNVNNTVVATSFTGSYDYNSLDNIPTGIVSSSSQIASDISGSFTAVSSSLQHRVSIVENLNNTGEDREIVFGGDGSWSNADNGNLVILNVNAGNITYTLPSSPNAGDNVTCVLGAAPTFYSASIDGNGYNIIGNGVLTTKYNLNTARFETVTIRYSTKVPSLGSGWVIISKT